MSALFGRHWVSQYYSGWARYTHYFPHVCVPLCTWEWKWEQSQVTGHLCRSHLEMEPAIFIIATRYLLWPSTVLGAVLVLVHLILMKLYEMNAIIMPMLNYLHVHYHYLHMNSWLRVTQLISVGVCIQIQVWLQIQDY